MENSIEFVYSPCVGMELHVREGVKGIIFMLNPNAISFSFRKVGYLTTFN